MVHVSVMSTNRESTWLQRRKSLPVPQTLSHLFHDALVNLLDARIAIDDHHTRGFTLCDFTILLKDAAIEERILTLETVLVASIAGIARAKYELIEALPSTGTAVLNADDTAVDAWLNCAVCHHMVDERDQALACVGRALELAPGLDQAVTLLQVLLS